MAFTDTVKFLNTNLIPITQLPLTKDSKRIAILSQDNHIKIWRVLDIYKWEHKLVNQIENGCYLYGDDIGFSKPLFVINDTSMNTTINSVRFSNLKYLIHEPKPASKIANASETTLK